jgi:hypothetical protein
MSNLSASDIVSGIVGLLTGFIGSLVALKQNNQTAETDLREDLLQLINHHSARISALEQENKELMQKNQELIQVNVEERQKQQDMLLKLAQMDSERTQMVNRIEYLENRLREVTDRLERILTK